MKKCTQCKTSKPLSGFHKNKRRQDGFANECKSCALDRVKRWQQRNPDKVIANQRKQRFARYGMTEQQYIEMLNNQEGKCAICKVPSLLVGDLCVDHDHKCCPDKSCETCIRGLLCICCNTAIGLLKEDTAILQAALSYLDKTARSSPVER